MSNKNFIEDAPGNHPDKRNLQHPSEGLQEDENLQTNKNCSLDIFLEQLVEQQQDFQLSHIPYKTCADFHLTAFLLGITFSLLILRWVFDSVVV